MLKARFMLLFASFVWGVAFVFQRIAIDSIGPFGFNAMRFLLASIALVPVCYFLKDTTPTQKPTMSIWAAGSIIASFLMIGSAMQQIGLENTTAGKAAFITALYIVLVPLAGIFFGQSLSFLAIFGIISAIVGVSFLTITSTFQIEMADFIILISTIFWTSQILCMAHFAPRYPCIRFSAIQFFIAGLLNLIVALLYEEFTLQMVYNAMIPILYGGIVSAAIGFTIQTVYQRIVPPTEVALILSLEMVFAAIAGWLILGETMTNREFMGVLLICIGVIAAQVPSKEKHRIAPISIRMKRPRIPKRIKESAIAIKTAKPTVSISMPKRLMGKRRPFSMSVKPIDKDK